MQHLSESTLSRYQEVLQANLPEHDDVALWVLVLETLVRDIALLEPECQSKYPLYLQIGVCSHWYRPHQTRWKAGGGFAWPSGYGGGHSLGWGGIPEYDASLMLKWDEHKNEWIPSLKRPAEKRKLICRVTIPARTVRHDQAAVSVLWLQGTPIAPRQKATWRYGFRRKAGQWECTAVGGFPEFRS